MSLRKPHFAVHISIASHRNTALLFADVLLRGIYCELGRLAIQKYASKTNDTFTMSTGELEYATGCKTASAAHRRMVRFLTASVVLAQRLGGTAPVVGQRVDDHWVVTIRNLAQKHGMQKVIYKKLSPKREERREKKKKDNGGGDLALENWPKAGKPKTIPPACMDLTRYMIKAILGWRAGVMVPKTDVGVERWAWHIEIMIRKDKRDPAKIRRMIDFLFAGNQEYSKPFVVLGTEGLRAKYDNIAIRGNAYAKPSRARARQQEREDAEAEERRETARRFKRSKPTTTEPISIGDALSTVKGETA